MAALSKMQVAVRARVTGVEPLVRAVEAIPARRRQAAGRAVLRQVRAGFAAGRQRFPVELEGRRYFVTVSVRVGKGLA